MYLNAIVIQAGVRDQKFFDQMTGAEKLGWVVEMTVLDADTSEKYDVVITEGLARLDELKEARRRNEHPDTLEQMASQLQAELPASLSRMQLEVLKFKGKQAAFIKLVCRVAVGAPVGA